ncbi:kinesin heavy chain-like [Amia ocellicauda]|uniref:kinesin heavy chain-like n=1 Tax=Amia ocellicauda TaxID=2972642 RepID=UPI00346467DC
MVSLSLPLYYQQGTPSRTRQLLHLNNMGNGASSSSSSTGRPIKLNPEFRTEFNNPATENTSMPDMCALDSLTTNGDMVGDFNHREKVDDAGTEELKLQIKESEESHKNMKEQYIQRLEQEIKESKEQIVFLKQKHRRKEKKLQTELMEAKQEASIIEFEMKEKIQMLQEEKLHTRDDNSGRMNAELQSGEDTRVQLILELSNQVSQQQEQIEYLQEALEERDSQLSALKGRQQSPAVHSRQVRTTDISGAPAPCRLQESSPTPERRTTTPADRCGSLCSDTDIARPPSGETLEHNTAMGRKQSPGAQQSLKAGLSLGNGRRSWSAGSSESGVSMTM